MFWVSIRRETHHRAQHRLAEWAAQNRFTPMNIEFGLPRPLDRVSVTSLAMTLGFYQRRTRLVHLRGAPPRPGDPPVHWNLAIRHVSSVSPPVGLRSGDAGRAVVDLFRLEPSPRQLTGGRFTIVGDDLLASRKLAHGSARALLPGDLSLLRVDEYLVIDFSGRPFDAIELGRMLGLLDQLASVV